MEKIKLEIKEFFNLPMSEKKKFWQTSENMEGFGQLFVVSEDQKLDWNDMFYMNSLPRKSRMPHLFPQLPHPFRFYICLYFVNFFLRIYMCIFICIVIIQYKVGLN